MADASCTSLPPSVRARSYSAVLSPMPSNAWAMKTVLSGTDFYDGLDSMFVGRNRDGLWFGVYSWDAVERWLEEYPVVERLTRTSYLAIRGKATAPFADMCDSAGRLHVERPSADVYAIVARVDSGWR